MSNKRKGLLMGTIRLDRFSEIGIWLNTWWAGVAAGVIVRLSKWLERHSESEFKRVQNHLGAAETPGQGSIEMSQGDQKNRMQLKTTSQQGVSADISQYSASKMTQPRWTEELVPFLANQLSDHTRRAYESDLKQFFLFLSNYLDLSSLEKLRPNHIILFRKALEEGRLTRRPLAKSTVNRKLAVVKSFFNWLQANQLMKDNPATLVKGYPQSQESSLQGLSDEETRKILDQPSRNSRAGALHGAILYTLFYLGLRKGELINLQMGDLDSERGVDVLKVRGKGHRIRILPLVPSVKERIDHYIRVCQRSKLDKEAPLFTPTKNPRTGDLSRPLNPYAITYIVQHYAKKVGILKTITPHSCRATCISNALDRKATHRSVQHLAGWSTPLMIQRYDKRREDLKNSAAFVVDYPEAEAL